MKLALIVLFVHTTEDQLAIFVVAQVKTFKRGPAGSLQVMQHSLAGWIKYPINKEIESKQVQELSFNCMKLVACFMI